jgi:hypothetical protein
MILRGGILLGRGIFVCRGIAMRERGRMRRQVLRRRLWLGRGRPLGFVMRSRRCAAFFVGCGHRLRRRPRRRHRVRTDDAVDAQAVLALPRAHAHVADAGIVARAYALREPIELGHQIGMRLVICRRHGVEPPPPRIGQPQHRVRRRLGVRGCRRGVASRKGRLELLVRHLCHL